MNQVSKAYDGEGLEWLYTHSRNYPLLSAEEERDIDERKWQTRDVLLEALLTDVRSRFFLKQWVSNLLENPPSLNVFSEKEHYYVIHYTCIIVCCNDKNINFYRKPITPFRRTT